MLGEGTRQEQRAVTPVSFFLGWRRKNPPDTFSAISRPALSPSVRAAADSRRRGDGPGRLRTLSRLPVSGAASFRGVKRRLDRGAFRTGRPGTLCPEPPGTRVCPPHAPDTDVRSGSAAGSGATRPFHRVADGGTRSSVGAGISGLTPGPAGPCLVRHTDSRLMPTGHRLSTSRCLGDRPGVQAEPGRPRAVSKDGRVLFGRRPEPQRYSHVWTSSRSRKARPSSRRLASSGPSARGEEG